MATRLFHPAEALQEAIKSSLARSTPHLSSEGSAAYRAGLARFGDTGRKGIDATPATRPRAGSAYHETPVRSMAVVLHGRMGGMASLVPGAPARPIRSLEGAVPSIASATLCAASLERHVIAPNRARFAIDVIGHSWSPEIGAALDALYAPRRSLHEHGVPMSRNFRCPATSFALHYCHRTVSHLLGISRAMALKKQQERERGFTYDLIFLSRWFVCHAP